MADYAQDIKSLQQVTKAMAAEIASLKKGLLAANDAIGDLHTEVAELKKRLPKH